MSFDHATTSLGHMLRHWVKETCSAFATRELPREEAARGRRKAAKQAKTAEGASKVTETSTKAKKQKRARRKAFNLCTYKLHALGHYVEAVRRFGTTDNYNTQVVRV